MACAGAEPIEFLTYQLSLVGYWPTMALTGNGELGFDSGEGARETATTSKEGSRARSTIAMGVGGGGWGVREPDFFLETCRKM